jgi:hypothetical protein
MRIIDGTICASKIFGTTWKQQKFLDKIVLENRQIDDRRTKKIMLAELLLRESMQ